MTQKDIDLALTKAVQEFSRQLAESRRTLGAKDLTELVKIALMTENITLSRAAEIMGLAVVEMRAISAVWLKGTLNTPELNDQ